VGSARSRYDRAWSEYCSKLDFATHAAKSYAIA